MLVLDFGNHSCFVLSTPLLPPIKALYAGGTFDGNHINNQPGNFTYLELGNIQVPGYSNRDAWVGKFDPVTGEPIWGTSMRGFADERVYTLSVDANNNVFAGGYTRSASIFTDYTFDGQFAANIYATSQNDNAILFVMNALSGAVRMANVYSKYELQGCSSCDESWTYGLAYNPLTGRMIMVGAFETSINLYPCELAGFKLKHTRKINEHPDTIFPLSHTLLFYRMQSWMVDVVAATYQPPINSGESAYFVQLAVRM